MLLVGLWPKSPGPQYSPAASQLPPQITDPSGRKITKPACW